MEDKTKGGILGLNINLGKVDKGALFQGKTGTWLGMTILLKQERDEYGNDGMIVQDIGKDRREAGERAEILGNAKWVSKPEGATLSAPVSVQAPFTPQATLPGTQPAPAPAPAQGEAMDEIPF